MKINNRDTFVLLEDEQNDLEKFALFLKTEISNKFKKQNIVIDLLKNDTLKPNELLLFQKASNRHKDSKHSFIIMNNAINPDDLPLEMVVVPTLQEAEDIIEMEEIERELDI